MKDNAGQFQKKITKNTGEYRVPVHTPIKNILIAITFIAMTLNF